MTQIEEDRIINFKISIQSGKRFFLQLTNYFSNEPELDANDVVQLSDNLIQIKYLYKPYLLELTHNEQLGLGQILVYESEIATHFLKNPKFILKATSQIYFDRPGNIFIANPQVAHAMPSHAAEDIIREVTK